MTFPDVDSFNTYGGHIVNGAPVEDASTDRDALLANQAYASVAAMTHTATQCWVRFPTTNVAGLQALSVTNPKDQAWPVLPTNADPTVTRNGVGDYTILWPTTVIDEDGATHTLSLASGNVTIEGTVWGVYTVTPVTASSLRIRLAGITAGAFAASDLIGATVLVEAI